MGVMGSSTVTVSSDVKKLLESPVSSEPPGSTLLLIAPECPVRAVQGHTTLKTALSPVPLTDFRFLLNFLPIIFLVEKLEERGRRTALFGWVLRDWRSREVIAVKDPLLEGSTAFSP